MRDICLVRAPSNLGLRPLEPGHVPGTWRAPQALSEAGLIESLAPGRVVDLDRPAYSTEPQPGTRLRNGPAIRRFNLDLAEIVTGALGQGEFPLIIGGDCSILLGALVAARRSGAVGLVHFDGHSDFRHPGNYDVNASLGSVAGMDLALATGRGEALLGAMARCCRSARRRRGGGSDRRTREPRCRFCLARHQCDRRDAHRRLCRAGTRRGWSVAKDKSDAGARRLSLLAASRCRCARPDGDAGGGFARQPRPRPR